jgi:hypothetical protein
MTKPLIQGDRVCKDQTFGTVDTIIERWIGSTLALRIIVVEWDDRNVSDEDEDDLDQVLPGAGVNQATQGSEIKRGPSPRPSLTKGTAVG